MSVIENLLSLENINDKQIKPSSKSSDNFIFTLINDLKNSPEELSDLLKNLNIKPEDLEKLSNKTFDLKKIQEKLNTDIKNPEIKENQKTFNINTAKTDKETNNEISLLAKLITTQENTQKNDEKSSEIETITKFFQQQTKTLSEHSKDKNIKKTDTKIVNITKHIIESSKILNDMKLNDKEINNFKNISSLKDLINFADKHNMNINKIIIQYDKNYPQSKKMYPKPKISKNIDFKNEKSLNFSQKTATQSKLSTLLLQKQPAKHSQDILQTSTDNNDYFLNIQNQKEHKHSKADSTEEKTSFISSNDKVFELKQNIMKAKSSIKHFASHLKEAVENYKPPISKIKMQMHPQELGKVDVTIVHRGDNLQIQINSNNTAVNFLHTQQQELKQNLINMGFTDVNMSFNSNQQQGNRQYKQNQHFSNTSNEENDEIIIEIPYQYA